MTIDAIKKKVARAAAEFIQDGMVVGLGTGSTTRYFIERLIERKDEGLHITFAASSQASAEIALQGGLLPAHMPSLTHIDITVDGADEIDAQKRMIKGGGGALLREKILATMSRELIIVVDETKLVSLLGKHKLPVEIVPFASSATKSEIEKLGYQGSWRKRADGSLFVTDNGNYLYDICFPHLLDHPEQTHFSLIQIPGVVETGFFFHLAGRVIVGFFDGQIVVRS